MSWIRDIHDELASLDMGKRKLRSFGIVMLLISAGLLCLAIIKGAYWLKFLLSFFFFLFLLGAFLPFSIKGFYRLWMGFSIALGWIISRVLLTGIYYIVVTPVAILARIFGKRFLETHFHEMNKSYWVKKEVSQSDYTKMS